MATSAQPHGACALPFFHDVAEFEMLSEDDFAGVPRLPRVPDAQKEVRNEVETGLANLTLYVHKEQAASSLSIWL